MMSVLNIIVSAKYLELIGWQKGPAVLAAVAGRGHVSIYSVSSLYKIAHVSCHSLIRY